jgi:hypothetical protein
MRDSCGNSGTVETPQARQADEAQRIPHGKRASWSGNQLTSLLDTKSLRKYPKLKILNFIHPHEISFYQSNIVKCSQRDYVSFQEIV